MALPQVFDEWSEIGGNDLANRTDDTDQRHSVSLLRCRNHSHRSVSELQPFEMDTGLSCDDFVWLMTAQVGQELVAWYVLSTPPTRAFSLVPQGNGDDRTSFTRQSRMRETDVHGERFQRAWTNVARARWAVSKEHISMMLGSNVVSELVWASEPPWQGLVEAVDCATVIRFVAAMLCGNMAIELVLSSESPLMFTFGHDALQSLQSRLVRDSRRFCCTCN
jgi:hypothetical protein